MKKLLILYITLLSLEAVAQISIDFIGTSGFHVIHLNDTIDANPNSAYSDSIAFDLFCDGTSDIILKSLTTPMPHFPDRHHIEVHNLTGTHLEFANINEYLDAFNTGEVVNPDTLVWESKSDYKLFNFTVFDGPTWAGYENEDNSPITVYDMNVLFRYLYNGNYKYGWINYGSYSGWTSGLIIHKIAFEELLCITTPTNQIFESNFKLFPNPFSSHLYLLPNQSFENSITWKIYGIDGTFIDHGKAEPNTFMILDNNKINKAGTYIIQFFKDGKFIESKTIVKI